LSEKEVDKMLFSGVHVRCIHECNVRYWYISSVRLSVCPIIKPLA